jgi:hypothetical protein
LRKNSGFDFALKGRGFSRAGKRRKIKINDGFNRLLNNSSFVSGHRFSDAVIL